MTASHDGGARPRLTPAIADVRRAVRDALAGLPAESVLVVGLSGGADSLALTAAVAFEAPRLGMRAIAVVVDHRLQSGSRAVADRAAAQAAQLGITSRVIEVRVETAGGPEAAARAARYAALAAAAQKAGAEAVLTAHTLDDQAETVLLGLARGSGPSSLSGMAPLSRPFAPDPTPLIRPLLGVRRATTRAYCTDAGLKPWDDPQNGDPAFTRVRVRERVLPVLEAELGPGVAEALARTAAQLRDDDDTLDHLAREVAEDLAEHSEAGIALPVRALASNPTGLRNRLIRYAVESEFHVTLTSAHTAAVAHLVTDWHGQGDVHLPGLRAARVGTRLEFTAAPAPASPSTTSQLSGLSGPDTPES